MSSMNKIIPTHSRIALALFLSDNVWTALFLTELLDYQRRKPHSSIHAASLQRVKGRGLRTRNCSQHIEKAVHVKLCSNRIVPSHIRKIIRQLSDTAPLSLYKKAKRYKPGSTLNFIKKQNPNKSCKDNY